MLTSECVCVCVGGGGLGMRERRWGMDRGHPREMRNLWIYAHRPTRTRTDVPKRTDTEGLAEARICRLVYCLVRESAGPRDDAWLRAGPRMDAQDGC